LIAWCVEALTSAGCSELVIVAPADSLEAARAAVDQDSVVVAGGDTRQESVYAGLSRIAAPQVVVHDAVRPFVTAGLVKLVVHALADADGAIAAVSLNETLKSAESGYVVSTIDRAQLWRAQTPQAFHTEGLVEAHRRAQEDGFVATDDAQLVERNGGRIAIVPSSNSNMKLTYPEDFEIAEVLIRSRG
jgi:2-C-methyl-D-erythritol 4-phosphate cytidylyltransferase